MVGKTTQILFIIILNLLVSGQIFAQQPDQKKLEQKRQALKDEIKKIRIYIDNTSKKETSLSTQVQDLNHKIITRQNLINTIDSEIDNLTNEIQKNTKKINSFQDELEKLKADYADMIYKSYKSRNADNQILFLLSSETFYQGYLRFQYLKQYSQYRKKQGELIVEKAEKLRVLNDSLIAKKVLKENLMEDKVNEQTQMESEKAKQQELIKKYQKEKKEYYTQIKKKQAEEQELTNQIENIIKAEIKKSTEKSVVKTTNTTKTTSKTTATTSKSNEFALAPEAKELSNQFSANKGKLPWPVEKGVVTVRFGKQPDPMDPNLTIESSGVRIATAENQKARAIFDGTVMAIQKNPQNGILSVLVQHGNYISVYANLRNIAVKKGDKVKTKQTVGTIHTDQINGKTILKFQIWQNDQKMDPALWIDGL